MPRIGEVKRARELGYKGRDFFIWVACPQCGKERWIPKRKGVKLCHSCTGKNFLSHGGKEHPAWKGGRIKTLQGYILVKLQPDDFFYRMTNKSGYVPEHRLVVAKHLNRWLLPWELVHHKDGVKDHNEYGNLVLSIAKHHLLDVKLKAYVKRVEKRVDQLEQRNTLLEAELTLLKEQLLRGAGQYKDG